MSAYEDDDDESAESLAETARRIQKFVASVPASAQEVSKLTAGEVKRMRKEISKVRLPRTPVKKVAQPQLPPRVTVPAPDTRYGTFAGKRKKTKNLMDVMMGR